MGICLRHDGIKVIVFTRARFMYVRFSIISSVINLKLDFYLQNQLTNF